jgi:hypothetical protein
MAALVLGLGGCADGGEVPCRFGAECESGVCLPSGECAPVEAGDAAVDDADGAVDAVDAGPPDPDGGASADAGSADAGPPGCGDGDGRIDAEELPLPVGESLELRVAFDEAVDSRGAERADGTRLWDFEGPYASDTDRTFVRRGLDGAWYAERFSGATYTLPLSAEDDLRGVFEVTRAEVRLVGIVSPDDGLSRTELEYDPPVPVWRFPLEVGASWEQTSTVSGVASGVTSVYTETWRVGVDARGAVGTPAGVREVLRVNTRITRTVGALVTVLRRHAYVEECAGTVAQLFGRDNDTDEEPSEAAELWRVR